ncbi:AMP-binding protein [Ramlibacter sp. AN1015]|uniref:AMP-binding protein n=1 Tax=Ramlibacter sp. AN1015 TaxID=3133428 RepID=UPI0030C16F17
MSKCSNSVSPVGGVPLFSSAATIPELIRQRANRTPTRPAFGFVADSDADAQEIDYATLYRSCTSVAAQLQDHGLSGERVLLVARSNRNFVVGFLACLMAGAVAVPAPCPRRDQLSERLQLLAEDSGALALLADSDEVVCFKPTSPSRPFAVLDLRLAPECVDAAWRPIHVDPESLALLQYTSGSTGSPKGVMVSHGNLMANSAALRGGLQFTHDSVQLVALPLFHDMGLIVGVVQPIFSGFTGFLMSPQMFAASPLRWLRQMSRLGVTHAGGPNFLFELAVESIEDEDLHDLDLSRWEVAYCGAEPVRASTMRRFSDKFGAVGFRHSAFMPAYGMAEATLYAASHLHHTEPSTISMNDGVTVRTLVACGAPPPHHRLLIVDPSTCLPCADGTQGEIWLSGPSVAQGYWNKPEATLATFGARLADSGDGPYLRTGDLGIVQDGAVYVSSRLKDLVIVRGRNFAPQDLEAVAEAAHPALRPSACAAFSLHEADADDRVVVVIELKRTAMRQSSAWPDAKQAIRRAILEAFEIRIDDVVLVRTASIPKTSSGKLQRSACAHAYRAGTLVVLEAPPGGVKAPSALHVPVIDIGWLQSELSSVIKRPVAEIDPHASFLDLNIDSLAAVIFSSRLAAKLRVEVDPPGLFSCGSLHEVRNWLGQICEPSIHRA